MIYTINTINTITVSTGWHETNMERLAKGKSLESIGRRVERICQHWWEKDALDN
jgi:hypothetical protein